MVLSKGYGKLVFLGNVSVEEGTLSHTALQPSCWCLLLLNDGCLQVCMISPPQT